jgi:glycine reductase
MDLKNKKIIALGERDGVQGSAIAMCVQSAGAEVVLDVTHCFVWTSAGALDLDGQIEIKQVVDRLGTDGMVVILGTPNAESSKLYGLTVTEGDPSWAGVLAGANLNLPVYHITEPEIKDLINPAVYEEQVGLTEMVLDTGEIFEALNHVRNGDA